MSEIFSFLRLYWRDFLDIGIIWFVFYQLLMWARGTRGMQLLRGLFIVILLYLISRFLELQTISWIFTQLGTIILIALIAIFQPELRNSLEKLGRGKFFSGILSDSKKDLGYLREIVVAVKNLSESKLGSLIAIEQQTGLYEYVETGIPLGANISQEIILSIFYKSSPVHDGAIIIQGQKIVAMGCFLPLTEATGVDKRLGTRHRAAIGLSEQTDAFIITTSENTGIISITQNGKMIRNLNLENLEEILLSVYRKPKSPTRIFFNSSPHA